MPKTDPISEAAGTAATLLPDISAIHEVPLHVQVELGRSSIRVRDLAALETGTVIELDKMTGEPADVVIDDRIVAKGEIVVSERMLVVRISLILGDGEPSS